MSPERRTGLLTLTWILHAIVATVLSGVAIVALAVTGLFTGWTVLAAILGGAAIAWPVAWRIAKGLV